MMSSEYNFLEFLPRGILIDCLEQLSLKDLITISETNHELLNLVVLTKWINSVVRLTKISIKFYLFINLPNMIYVIH